MIHAIAGWKKWLDFVEVRLTVLVKHFFYKNSENNLKSFILKINSFSSNPTLILQWRSWVSSRK